MHVCVHGFRVAHRRQKKKLLRERKRNNKIIFFLRFHMGFSEYVRKRERHVRRIEYHVTEDRKRLKDTSIRSKLQFIDKQAGRKRAQNAKKEQNQQKYELSADFRDEKFI